MNCTKCGTPDMKVQSMQDLSDDGVLRVALHLRCDNCWEGHMYISNGMYLNSTCKDEPQLMSMHGEGREYYFKCSRPGNDTYTLVARKSYATKERLEAMGFTVHERDDDMTLPAYRLYELK